MKVPFFRMTHSHESQMICYEAIQAQILSNSIKNRIQIALGQHLDVLLVSFLISRANPMHIRCPFLLRTLGIPTIPISKSDKFTIGSLSIFKCFNRVFSNEFTEQVSHSKLITIIQQFSGELRRKTNLKRIRCCLTPMLPPNDREHFTSFQFRLGHDKVSVNIRIILIVSTRFYSRSILRANLIHCLFTGLLN